MSWWLNHDFRFANVRWLNGLHGGVVQCLADKEYQAERKLCWKRNQKKEHAKHTMLGPASMPHATVRKHFSSNVWWSMTCFDTFNSEPRCRRLNDNGELVETGCGAWASFSCDRLIGGCPASHVYYTCSSRTGTRRDSDEYLLLCSTMNNAKCGIETEGTDVICEQCCISDDCGTKMRKCSSFTGNLWFSIAL